MFLEKNKSGDDVNFQFRSSVISIIKTWKEYDE